MPAAADDMEQAVIREWAAGSELAGELLIRRYTPLVYGLCLRILRGDVHAAEDATQDTFVNAWRARRRISAVRDVGRWLCTVATRVCLNLLRRGRHPAAPVLVPDADQLPDSGPIPAGVDLGALVEEIDGLPEMARLALLCRVYMDLPNRDAAEILGVSPEAYRVLVHRGLKSLRSRFPEATR